MPQGTLLAFFSNLIIPQFQISASGKLFAFAQTRSVEGNAVQLLKEK
jgi:hypothetical protein